MRSGVFTDEEAERSSLPGNRWPRQETLALLKIRSDMDSTFRDSTLKGPLWEEISRQLAALGYERSAKKCKEKFENVQKYYKRTKDGKTYRFFSQLEALQNPSSATLSLPADSLFSSASESEEEDDPRNTKPQKMVSFFEGLVNQVIERQEMMQQRFLETIERREEERTMREEAWRRQEMTRVQREKEILSQERALSASRDASIVAFLQKMTGHVVPRQDPPSAPSPPSDLDQTASRWPKSEVHALIQLRIGLETKYQEAGPKGPLWEEIAAGMKKMGYSRNPKRCKEKWENINKYFKKVKENKKRRPEDAKTCPYFHQLEALYRKKLDNGSGIIQKGRDPDVDPEEDDDDRRRKTGVNGTVGCGTSSSCMAMVL